MKTKIYQETNKTLNKKRWVIENDDLVKTFESYSQVLNYLNGKTV